MWVRVLGRDSCSPRYEFIGTAGLVDASLFSGAVMVPVGVEVAAWSPTDGSRMIRGVTTPEPAQVSLRRATKQDVAALVHLRSLMFASMGSDVGGQDAAWRVAATRWFQEQLAQPQQFAGFVIEHPVDGVVCAALGSCDTRAPSPEDVRGAHGHVFNISTEPAHRRFGYAQACLTALLTWFQKDTRVLVVDLNATPDGVGMYQSAGFHESRFPSMRKLMQRPAEG